MLIIGISIATVKELPIFKDEYTTQKTANSRPWFNSAEYSKLHNSIAAYAKKVQKVDSRKYAYALELYDFVIFATNTGMRIGELRNCKISDVKIVKEKLTSKEIIIISNIDGKRGKGTCQSYYGAVKPFRDILKRRGLAAQRSSPKKHSRQPRDGMTFSRQNNI